MNDKINCTWLYDVDSCDLISNNLTVVLSLNVIIVAQWSRHRAGRRLIASSNPTPARYRRRPCGVAWMPFRTLMVEYINKLF